jgi:hypothetical protein
MQLNGEARAVSQSAWAWLAYSKLDENSFGLRRGIMRPTTDDDNSPSALAAASTASSSGCGLAMDRHGGRSRGPRFAGATEGAECPTFEMSAFWVGAVTVARGGVGMCQDLTHARQQAPCTLAAHSITSSARASNAGGTVSPSAFAVLRFRTNSNLVICSIGRSCGFSPRRSRSA